MSSQYSFPILTNAEILACLAELDIAATEDHLLKPTPETARAIYEPLVLLLVGVTREELHQPTLTALDCLEFPELHEESIANLAFTRALTKLVTVAGVHDFSLADMYKPEPKTVRRTLSAIINLAKFREEKVVAYEELREASETTLERKAALQKDHDKLSAELAALRAAREAESSSMETLEEENRQLAGRIAAANKEQGALHAEVKALKAEGNELGEQCAAEKFALATARTEESKLRRSIVQSPARLQRSLVDLTNQIERDKGLVAEAEKRGRELAARLNALSKVESDVTKCTKLMAEADAEVTKHKDVARELKAAKAEIQSNEEEMWRVDRETQHFKRQEATSRERIHRLDEQGAIKMEAAQTAVAAAMDDRNAVQSHNAATQAKIAELDHQIQAMHRQMEDATYNHEKEMSTVAYKYAQLEGQVRAYHAQLLAEMAPDLTAQQPQPV